MVVGNPRMTLSAALSNLVSLAIGILALSGFARAAMDVEGPGREGLRAITQLLEEHGLSASSIETVSVIKAIVGPDNVGVVSPQCSCVFRPSSKKTPVVRSPLSSC